MHNELWARTWQIVILGTISTFVFTGFLVVCIKIMGAWAKGGAKTSRPAGENNETEKE